MPEARKIFAINIGQSECTDRSILVIFYSYLKDETYDDFYQDLKLKLKLIFGQASAYIAV